MKWIMLLVAAGLVLASCGPAGLMVPESGIPTAVIVSTSAPLFAPASDATAVPTEGPAAELIDVYAAPNGIKLGPVDLAGEVVQVVARGGQDWAQLQRPDTSKVWAMRADLPGNLNVPDSLPDLLATPVPAQRPAARVVQWQAPAATSAPAVTATPAPAPTATIVWATSAPARAEDFKAPDANASCAFTGCLHPPTAVPGNTDKPVERQKP